MLCNKAAEIGRGNCVEKIIIVLLFNKHLLSTSYMPGTVQEIDDCITEQIKFPHYHEAYILLSHVNLFGL